MAIRNSLVLLLPVVFAGAMARLFAGRPYALLPVPALPFAYAWRDLALLVAKTMGAILPLGMLVATSHFLVHEARTRRHVDVSPPLIGALALANFFVLMRSVDSPAGEWFAGTQNVLPAIVAAVGTCELFIACSRLRWLRFGQHAHDLDPALHGALTAIGPALATVTLFALASHGWVLLSQDLSLHLARALIAIDGAARSGLPSLLLLDLLNQLLWFVGLHGPILLEGVHLIRFADTGDPLQLFDISKRFFVLYVHLGGSGSTLGLLLAIALYARHGEEARVARYAALPSLFNINEVVLFGLPVILNPAYLLPFVLAPMAQTVLAYACLRQGWIALDATLVPWMTPPVLSGTLNAGSWHGGALQLVCIVLSALIYAPFVRIAARRRADERRATLRRTLSVIERAKQQYANVLDRHDHVGHTARTLLREFWADLGSERVHLAYQPQHDTRDRVVGVEALLRWRHAQHGQISPAVVCALLEEAQRIIPFGRWAIATACAQLQEWKRAGVTGVRISINVSPMQLRDSGLVAHIAGCLRDCELTASEVGIEITESQRVPDDEVSLATLKGLEDLGLPLEMDDFGMGYSSMLYIRRFRFAAIKLDGVLTRDVLNDRNSREIIATVVRLGVASGIRVVAEYVEDREQQRILAELGCTEFQGYLYSRPLAAADCLDYLLAGATPPVSTETSGGRHATAHGALDDQTRPVSPGFRPAQPEPVLPQA